MMPRPRTGHTRPLRLESLEDRTLLTVSSLTPAQAIAALNAQSAIVATQTTQTQNAVLYAESSLLTVARQLDAKNFSQLQTDTQQGNTQASLADMSQRNSVVAAEQRITSEYSLLNSNLITANQDFRNLSALLVTGVSKGTITPAVAVAAQVSDYEVYKSAALGVQTQSSNDFQLELVNLTGLTTAVEGVAGQKNLGNFYGKFDVKAAGLSPGVLTDYQGVVTTHFTVSADLLQGTFTAATTDYLQAYATVGSSTQLVKQPITGGTMTATISPSPDSAGFTIHGTVLMQFGPIDNLPSSSQTFQFEANMTGQNILIGNLLVGNAVVGSFNWTRQ